MGDDLREKSAETDRLAREELQPGPDLIDLYLQETKEPEPSRARTILGNVALILMTGLAGVFVFNIYMYIKEKYVEAPPPPAPAYEIQPQNSVVIGGNQLECAPEADTFSHYVDKDYNGVWWCGKENAAGEVRPTYILSCPNNSYYRYTCVDGEACRIECVQPDFLNHKEF